MSEGGAGRARQGVETTLACHLLVGVYLLATLAMGALEASDGGRVVVVSSGGERRPPA